MNLNKVFLLGNLTRDPETRALPSGQSVVSFGLATNRFYTTREGEKKQEAEFHNITVFGRLADIASQYLNKGSMVMIEGRLRTRSWQDAGGNTKYRTEIIAENLQLGPRLGERKEPINQRQVPQQEEIPIIEESSPSPSPSPKKEPEENPEPEVKKENPSLSTKPPDEELDVSQIPF